ncbi:hypothetical protein ColTof4_11432 [Colletotrichum tofieldiae]|nr:hypothetical protein ColTof3_04617 [Colletotrichum tofieldiae]GKT79009.1 hypothetical protein ColTof4_11432 [Colletotrichum tofieldiae]GKT86833.1 hypothetical protein Ct61P_04683 [Colletotrichum tofieldiae]
MKTDRETVVSCPFFSHTLGSIRNNMREYTSGGYSDQSEMLTGHTRAQVHVRSQKRALRFGDAFRNGKDSLAALTYCCIPTAQPRAPEADLLLSYVTRSPAYNMRPAVLDQP